MIKDCNSIIFFSLSVMYIYIMHILLLDALNYIYLFFKTDTLSQPR